MDEKKGQILSACIAGTIIIIAEIAITTTMLTVSGFFATNLFAITTNPEPGMRTARIRTFSNVVDNLFAVNMIRWSNKNLRNPYNVQGSHIDATDQIPTGSECALLSNCKHLVYYNVDFIKICIFYSHINRNNIPFVVENYRLFWDNCLFQDTFFANGIQFTTLYYRYLIVHLIFDSLQLTLTKLMGLLTTQLYL